MSKVVAVELHVGRSGDEAGVDWIFYTVGADGSRDTAGSNGKHDYRGRRAGPGRPTPDAWVEWCRRNVRLPECLPRLGRGNGYGRATAVPSGWSEGAGHAPHGVVITWQIAE